MWGKKKWRLSQTVCCCTDVALLFCYYDPYLCPWWGSIIHAVGQLLVISPALRAGWNLQQYAHNRQAHERDDWAHSVKVEVVDSSIRSNFWWAYAYMVDCLGECIELMAKSGEGCMCHPKDPEFQSVERHKPKERRAHRRPSCPMRTMNAPAFAAGEWLDILNSLLRRGQANLFLHPAIAILSPEERTAIMEDFASGCLSCPQTTFAICQSPIASNIDS